MTEKDWEKKCLDIIKRCELTERDLVFIAKNNPGASAEEIYYVLEDMLEKQEIKLKK